MIVLITDIGAIRHNISEIKKRTGRDVLFVVKADAYGHGAERVAKATEDAVAMFGVADAAEGVKLRKSGIKKGILVLGAMACPKLAEKYGLTVTVSTLAEAQRAAQSGCKIKAHIKADTGMNRFGVKDLGEFISILDILDICKNAEVCGIYSHIADSVPETAAAHLKEFKKFTTFMGVRTDKKILTHFTASGNIDKTDFCYDLVRTGIAVYGYGEGFVPALSAVSRILQIKYVKKGEYVGYSRAFTAEKDMKIAVVSGGYADGLNRHLTGKNVSVKGKPAKICGNICMDSFICDVTQIECGVGDTVVILDGGEYDAERRAEELGTIPYEILTGFHGRIKRIYI